MFKKYIVFSSILMFFGFVGSSAMESKNPFLARAEKMVIDARNKFLKLIEDEAPEDEVKTAQKELTDAEENLERQSGQLNSPEPIKIERDTDFRRKRDNLEGFAEGFKKAQIDQPQVIDDDRGAAAARVDRRRQQAQADSQQAQQEVQDERLARDLQAQYDREGY